MADKKDYKEGHKRETRKSYQAYIEGIAHPELSSASVDIKTEPNTDEVVDDGNIRRSRRTPVPKRNFKLIDDFEKKDTPKKKEKKGRKTTSLTPQKIEEEIDEGMPVETAESLTKVVPPIIVSVAEPDVPAEEKEKREEVAAPSEDALTEDQEEEVAPRKSGRVRKPKEFKDSITPAFVKKSVERSRKTSKAEGDLEADSSVPLKPENKASRKRKISESSKKKENEFDVNLVVKEEVFTESSQTEDSQQEDEVATKRRKRSKGSSADAEQSFAGNQKRKSPKRGTPQIKLKFKPMAERPPEAIPEEQESAPKKKDKKKKKRTEKLIVSFKKKKSSEKKDENDAGETSQVEIERPKITDVKFKEEPIFETPKKGDQVVAELHALSSSPKKSKSKKKSKEKKKGDANKNQKVIDVQTFDVEDQNIVKVKKKKIYKKKKGVKILVRMIKNHCNKAGEIVKTETVAVDGIKVEVGGAGADKKEDCAEAVLPVVPMDEKDDEDGIDDDSEGKEKKPTSDATGVDVGVEQETVAEDDVVETGGRGQRIKKPKNKDIYEKKKPTKQQHSVKKVPEKRLRKGGKNVTIGGKVVGKTTKGLKRTGERPKGVATVKTKKPCPCCTGKLLLITEPIHSTSEPKNAYNLFCRKYRPIIVANHPRADFSEISRRLAAIWKNASNEDRAVYFEVFGKMECAFRNKLGKFGRQSPSTWSETEFQYIKEAISHDLPFQVPTYPQTLLQPVDMAAHLQILGESLAAIGGALQQQSSITVHGAMSLMLDSMLCALGPLISMTSYIPEMKAVDSDDLAKTMDNISYILPGL